MDASLFVGVDTGVAPERSFCFFNAVCELVLQMIARCFASATRRPNSARSCTRRAVWGRSRPVGL